MDQKTNIQLWIILGNGSHCGMGYVTGESAVQLVSKLCKLFWHLTFELTNQFDKVRILQGLIGHIKVIRSNNLHNLETS